MKAAIKTTVLATPEHRRFIKDLKMASGTSLIGHSKVMAHLMPNIVPPIDREYTLNFLKGHSQIQNGLDGEWDLMRSIIEGLFIPLPTIHGSDCRPTNGWKTERIILGTLRCSKSSTTSSLGPCDSERRIGNCWLPNRTLLVQVRIMSESSSNTAVPTLRR